MTKSANFLNPRWRTAAILKIVKSPYVSKKLFDFDEIRYTTANGEPNRRSHDQKLKFLKFKMAVIAILKIAFVAVTHRRFSDFGEILCKEEEWHADKSHMTKTANF